MRALTDIQSNPPPEAPTTTCTILVSLSHAHTHTYTFHPVLSIHISSSSLVGDKRHKPRNRDMLWPYAWSSLHINDGRTNTRSFHEILLAKQLLFSIPSNTLKLPPGIVSWNPLPPAPPPIFSSSHPIPLNSTLCVLLPNIPLIPLPPSFPNEQEETPRFERSEHRGLGGLPP